MKPSEGEKGADNSGMIEDPHCWHSVGNVRRATKIIRDDFQKRNNFVTLLASPSTRSLQELFHRYPNLCTTGPSNLECKGCAAKLSNLGKVASDAEN